MKSSKSWTIGKFVVQVVWPDYIHLKSEFVEGQPAHDFFIGFQTAFRLQWQKDYFQIGFSILGFGIGFDWLKEAEK